MASRIVGIIVVVFAAAALLFAAFGPDRTETAEVPPAAVATTPPVTADATEPGSDSAGDDAAPSASSSQSETEPAPAPAATATPEPTIEEPENFGPRMDLVELDGWLNTDATDIDDFNGQVVLVEMWTFGCHNCQARIPFNQSYRDQFADENFSIIGVHAPEFNHEAEVPNIIEASARLGVDWPIALDTEKKNFRAWQPGTTNFWPRTYVIDQNGDIRYDHIGEGRYEELRETIQFLIDNPPAPKGPFVPSS